MKKLILAIALMFLLSLMLTACSSNTVISDAPGKGNEQSQNPEESNTDSEMPSDDPNPTTTSDDLIAQGYFIVDSDDNYTVYALSREGGGYEHYLYRIGAEEPYLAEGIYAGSTCAICYLNGILRLNIGSGNVQELQYFDLDKGIKSELIWLDSQSVEYVDSVGEDYIIAYIAFDTSKEGIPAYLVIKDIFTNDLISIIERPFNRGTAPLNEIKFVNKNEIYIDYDIDFVNGEYVDIDKWINAKETINFR